MKRSVPPWLARWVPVLALALGACEKPNPETQAIRAVFASMVQANLNSDGETAAAVITASSSERYPPLVRLAINADRAELERLDAWDLSEVLLMRLLGTRGELEGLDGRGYVAFAAGRGWYAIDPGVEQTVDRVRVSGDTATARLLIDGEPTESFFTFRREDGVWKFDEESWRADYNAYIAEGADEAGVSIPEYIVQTLEEDHGREAPPSIWVPMKNALFGSAPARRGG